jgi:hypothetical protein
MVDFEKTMDFVDKFLNLNSIPYVLIGGLAVFAHKITRFTKDIDLTLAIEVDDLNKVGKLLVSKFKPLKDDPIDFFERYFVLPSIFEPTGVRIDFSAGLSGFDKDQIDKKYLIRTAKSFVQIERYDILENLEKYFKMFGI